MDKNHKKFTNMVNEMSHFIETLYDFLNKNAVFANVISEPEKKLKLELEQMKEAIINLRNEIDWTGIDLGSAHQKRFL